MKISEAIGIEIRAHLANDVLCYELKIPLLTSAKHPYAVGAGPGSLVGLGFTTPSVDRDAMMASRGGGGRGGGSRRGGGRRSGGESVRGRMPSGLDAWVRIQLSAHSPDGS